MAKELPTADLGVLALNLDGKLTNDWAAHIKMRGFTDQVGMREGAPRAYGYRRLQTLLQGLHGRTAHEISDAMRADLLDWQGSQMRRDDVTAVVFQPA